MQGGGELEGGWETHESHCEGEIDLTSQMDGGGHGNRRLQVGGEWRELVLGKTTGIVRAQGPLWDELEA